MSASRRGAPHVNLLPLLDVLLCTMGTLIVVLGVLNRQARENPAKTASGRLSLTAAKQTADDIVGATEQLEFQINQLTAARDKTAADLEAVRSRLGGIEDHSRRIVKQIEDLQAAAKQLPDAASTNTYERDALRAELARLTTERMRLGGDLSKAKVNARYRKPAFAVVPFDGIHKTQRRPIYLECRADCVILQPEGIVFTPDDFLGPGGPGNPLAAALRAAQEYWSQQPPPAANIPNEPYPLLLVRPDGIIGYYLARGAMTSWDAEFGYELVDADWKLDYPLPPQVTLKSMEQRAVAEARDRLAWLAQTSPELFERKAKVQYRLSATGGGLERQGGRQLGGVDPFANDPLGGFGRSKSAIGGSGEYDSAAYGTRGNTGNVANGLAGSPDAAAGGAYSSFGSGGSPGLHDSSPSARGNSAIGGYGAGGNPGLAGGDANLGTGGNGQFAGINNGSAGGASNSVFGSGYGENDHGGGSVFGNMPGGGGANSGSTIAGGSGTGGQGDGMMAGDNSAGGKGALSQNGGQFGGPSGQQAGYPYGSSTSNSPSGALEQAGTGQYGAGPNGPLSNQSDGQRGSATGANGQRSAPGQGNYGGTASEYGGVGGSSFSGTSSGSAGGSSWGSSSGSPSASSMGQGAGGDPSALAAGMPSPSFEVNNHQASQSTASRSVADIRGRNWAIANDTNASVPITRPVRLECWPDRIVVISDSRDQQSQVIPLKGRTEESIDQIVGAVREHTRRWGMAGRGMYWKPQLTLDVNPNGDARAKDLQILLANSGMDVKRK